jgi:SAM-dependent methyltransferase
MDAEQLARYWWAAQAVGGKEVLDAGCGAGEGARILVDAGAERVTGVVASQAAQSEAVRRAGDVAMFVAAKLEALPFAPASFDIAVCFDLVDSSEQRSELLEELHRVLREDGSLLLAWTDPDGLEAELASRFATVALHRQHPRLASAILADGLSDGEAMLTVRAIAPLDSFQAPVTLAVACKREAPALADVVALGDPFEARSWEDRVDCARRETDEALRRLEQAREGERHLSAERDLLARRLIEAEQARARSLSLEERKGRRGDDGTSGREAVILALGPTVSPRIKAVRSAAKTLLGLRR